MSRPAARQITEASAMKKARNVLKDLIQIGLDSGAIVITGGAAGDTVVDVLFALDESGEMAKSIEKVMSTSEGLRRIFDSTKKIDLSKGTKSLYEGVKEIITELVGVAGEQGEKLLEEIKEEVEDLIGQLARAVSKWIASILPDDFGLGGPTFKVMIDEALEQSGEYAFDAVSAAWNAAPDKFKAVVLNDELLTKLLNAILDQVISFLEEFSKSGGKSFISTAATGVATAMTAGAGSFLFSPQVTSRAVPALVQHLDKNVRGQIPLAVEAIQGCITALFVCCAVLQVILTEDWQETSKSEKKPEPEAQEDVITSSVEKSEDVIREFISASWRSCGV